MPKGPSDGMPMPGGFVNRMSPQIQQIIQSLQSKPAEPQPQNSSGGGGGFWNPNGGMPSPDIANTPSTNSPTTPFAMPQAQGTMSSDNSGDGSPTRSRANPAWGAPIPYRNWGGLPSPPNLGLSGLK